MSTESAAIHEDVASEEAPASADTTSIEPVVEPTLDINTKTSRDDIMAQISARRQEQLRRELGEPEPETEAAAEEPKEAAPAPPAPKVKVKVDGVESEVTAAEIREYQKQKAADTRLEELNRKARDLAAREAALTEKERSRRTQPRSSNVNLDELSGQLIESVFQEDKARVREVLSKLRADTEIAVPRVDASEVTRIINQHDAEKERQTAVTRFRSEYKALASNPALYSAVDQQTILERERDPEADVWTIIDRAAKRVKQDITETLGLGPAVQNGAVLDKDSRLEAKRMAGPAVRPSVTSKAPLDVAAPRSQLSPFEEIKRARGQV